LNILAKENRFYAAEVCLVLKFLHARGILHRDLRLENIMLALDGHIKVIDFGLCAEDIWYGSTTHTFCGNSEFIAPEVFLPILYPTI
jgi:serine/threonine protein kinase